MAQQRNSSKLLIGSLFTILATTSLILGGCTDDQSTVGSKFIPENEVNRVKIDTSYDVDAYNQLNDTIRTSNFSVGLIGSMANDLFGKTSATFASEIYPIDTTVVLQYCDPKVDSVFFTFTVENYVGSKGKEVKISIHELTDSLKTLNLNSSYDLTGKYNSIALADTSIVTTGSFSIRRKEGAAKLFAERLLLLNKLEKDSAKAFRKKGFYGLYFNTDPLLSNGIFYKVTAASVQIKVYFHYTSGSKKNVKGQTFFSLRNFEDSRRVVNADGSKGKSHRVISLKHDRSAATVNFNSAPSDPEFHISSMGGAMGVIDLSKYVNGHWRDSAPCIISRAELVVEHYSTINTDIARIPNKLGLFQLDSSKGLVPIIDVFLEEKGATGSYNGSFQKGRLKYSMNITRYFQSLIDDKNTPSKLYMLPDYQIVNLVELNGDAIFYNNYSYGVFRGTTNSSPIKLIITYSKLKK